MRDKTLSLSTLIVGFPLSFVPVFFSRGTLDSFELPKATVLWMLLPALFVVSVWTAGARFKTHGRSILIYASCLLASVVATLFSFSPEVSLFGQYQRQLGLVTLISCLLVGFVTQISLNRFQLRVSSTLLVAASFLCALYGLVQSLGGDPWNWSTPGQDQPVFGTMGNSNTATFLVAGCVGLSVWLQSDSKTRFGASCAGLVAGFLGGSVNMFGSFQGRASLGLVSVVLVFLSFSKSFRVVAEIRSVLLFCLASGFAFVPGPDWWPLVSGLVGFAFTWFLFPLRTWPDPSIRFVVLARLAVGLGVLGISFFGRNRVQSELAQSMAERGDFYRAAGRAFLERPIFGWGPDTFGLIFTKFRPSGHAITLESNRTSSAHSIFFDLLVGGGFLLVLPIVVLLIYNLSGFFKAYREVRQEKVWALIALLVCLIQGLVSVGHPALYLMIFYLVGILGNRVTSSGFSVRYRGTQWGVIASAVLLTLVSTPFGTRVIRADAEAMKSLKQLYAGSPDRALSEIDSAIRIDPWSSMQRVRRVEVLDSLGRAEEVLVQAKQVLDEPGMGQSRAANLVYLLAKYGDYSSAADYSFRVLANDPFAPLLRQQLADLQVQIGDGLRNQGDSERAAASYSIALDILPGYERAVVGLETLGQ